MDDGVIGRVSLFSTRYTRVTIRLLREGFRLASDTGITGVGRVVHACQAEVYYSSVASAEEIKVPTGLYGPKC